jgi:squalene-hopene/tetraprenyl-beta-curcumene cyclase
MKRTIWEMVVACTAVIVGVCAIVWEVPAAWGEEVRMAEDDAGVRARVREAISRGVRWLTTQQQSDGSFADRSIVNEDGSVGNKGINPALTGLVVYGIAKSPLVREMRNTEMFRRAVAYIRGSAKPDGGIYGEPFASTYQTSVCLCALSAVKDPEDARTISAAQRYLKNLQASERVGISVTDASYGGWGYSAGAREADLSNLQFALTALKESGLTSDDAVWEKAVKFVEKCQNIKVDGGFIYRPGESKAGVDEKGNYRSYTSMTYAGLLSFIYCNVDKDDERVVAAVKWLGKHYNLEENVPIGKQGLYYSYHTMAKALAAYGERVFVDSEGRKHEWYRELASALLNKQDAKGFWVNTSSRWFETDRVLVTSYAILVLSEGYGAGR